MRFFRIASKAYSIFDGTGAQLHGARWNSPGFRIIYAAPNLSCARLELMAHIGRNVMPRNHAFVIIEAPDAMEAASLDPANLPEGWDSEVRRDIAQRIGDEWAESRRTALLRVPSVASPHEFNVLINQDHSDFGQIAASPPIDLAWDKRHFD
jgi:RES domain-containing protein